MGRPNCCCINCYSIWAIDANDGQVLWKKDFGYIYSISEYGDYVFILTVDGDYQVICLEKASGRRVDDKSFIIHYHPSDGEIYARDADNIYVYSSRTDQKALFRYVNQELVNVYKFASPNFKFLNERLIGYGGYDEDYHYYFSAEVQEDRIIFRFNQSVNIDVFSLLFTLVHEKYNISMELGTDGSQNIQLNSSENDLVLDDIIFLVENDNSSITIIFVDGLASNLENILYYEPLITVESSYSIYNRIFGTGEGTTSISPEYENNIITDGLGNRLEFCVQAIRTEAWHVENHSESIGEMLPVLCTSAGPITIPSLIEVFTLIGLEFERKTFTDSNSAAINFSETMLNKKWYMREMSTGYDTIEVDVNGDAAGLYAHRSTELLTGKILTREYTKDNSKFYSYNRDYSYGINLPLSYGSGVEERFRSIVSPTCPITSTPLDTIAGYVDVNSATELQYNLRKFVPFTGFINANNSLNEGYIKNIFSAIKVNNIHYDKVEEKYLLNTEKLVHWIYLRNEYLSFPFMYGTINTPSTLVDTNAAGISPVFVTHAMRNGERKFGPTVIDYPDEASYVGNVGNPILGTTGYNFGDRFYDSERYSYLIIQNQAESNYIAGYFSITDQKYYEAGRLTNMYGFDVSLDASTGLQYGNRYQSEIVWHKFTEIVMHTFGFNDYGYIDFRLVYTIPVNLEFESETLDSFTSNFVEPILPYNTVPTTYESHDFYDAIYGMSFRGTDTATGNDSVYNQEMPNDFGIKYDSKPNQPQKNPNNLYLLNNNDYSNYGTMDFVLNEDENSALPRRRYNASSDINLEYFKTKTKLIYDENYNQIFTNNTILEVTQDNTKSYIYYKSIDGILSSQIDTYHIRYNISTSTTSPICPFLVFHPIDDYELENGQAKIVLFLRIVNIIDGVKTFTIRRIEKDIDLTNGDLTPILDELNEYANNGTFEFLGINTNITDDYVFIIFEYNGEPVDLFSGTRNLTTEPVTISSNQYDGTLIDGIYYYP